MPSPKIPQPETTHQTQKKFAELLKSSDVEPKARAEAATYFVQQVGLDAVPPLAEVLSEADQFREMKAKADEENQQPLVREYFIEKINHQGKSLAAITSGSGETCVPCSETSLKGLRCGDPVLVNPRSGKIEGVDGQLPVSGHVAVIESLLPDGRRAEVKHFEHSMVVLIADRLRESGASIGVGTRVVFDPVKLMVSDVVRSETTGHDLLVDVSVLDKVDLDQISSLNSLVEDLMQHISGYIESPDWFKTMNVRSARSFLLAGPTGTGKTTTLNALGRCVTDHTERITGKRISRLVTVNASDFYTPLFGETEQKIVAFFDKLKRLGRVELTDINGQAVTIPLVLVIEEAEALFRSRGLDIGGSGHLFDRPLSLILQMCSSVGCELDAPIILCITSNRPTLLDSAALRRFGMRKVVFSGLSAAQAAGVLARKISENLPLLHRECYDTPADAWRGEINRIIAYLYGEDPDQTIAEVRMVDSSRRPVHRRSLVTPALLEDALSAATDECLRDSRRARRLLGLDTGAVIAHLEAQFESIALSLRNYNIEEYLPTWFSDETVRVESVRAMPRRSKKARTFHVYE